MTIKIPEKYYVVITRKGLGFASPYTKDAAFEKRKATQDKWAYGSTITTTITDTDDVECKQVSTSNNFDDVSHLFMTKQMPHIFKNELMEGFEVAKSVRRSGGWNGAGNVVWRVFDPRGFELEISSENLARIIDCTNIDKGSIAGKCIWGRDGSNNVLLPEASDVYSEAVTFDKKLKNSITEKNVNVGDTVMLLTEHFMTDQYVFYGKYDFLLADSLRSLGEHGETAFQMNRVVSKRLFQNVKTGKYVVIASPKYASVVSNAPSPMTRESVAEKLNADISNVEFEDTLFNVVLIAPTINNKQVVVSLESFDDYNKSVPEQSRGDIDSVFFETIDGLFVCSTKYNKGSYIPIAKKVTMNKSGYIRLKEKDKVSKSWNWRGCYTDIEIPIPDLQTVKKFKLVVTCGTYSTCLL